MITLADLLPTALVIVGAVAIPACILALCCCLIISKRDK